MMRFLPVLATAAVMLFAHQESSLSQPLPPGPQVLTFFSDVDDTEQPYAIYLPPDYDESRLYPLVISLHGAGSNHRLNLQRVFGKTNLPGESDVEASRTFKSWKDRDYIVASPFARGTMGYQGVAEKDVLDVLADVKRRFPIDEDRVYLTGLSMGGGGTLWLGLSRPDIWAAIAPVCPSPPSGTDALAANAGNLPGYFFHGDADSVVPVDISRDWVQRLRELGTHVDYEEYEGVGHDSWGPAYADGRVFDWFDQFRRDPFPERVRFATARYAANSAYWVRFDEITPGTTASIDARFTEPNTIEAQTSALDGFTLLLAGHPQFDEDGPVTIVVDGSSIGTDAAPEVSLLRENGVWRAGKRERHDELRKRPRAEGPMSRAVAGRHVYVYGTAGDASPGEIEVRYQQAVTAGTWSGYRGWFLGRVMVFPRIIADREVRASDFESANLVLLGTRETNSLIAELAERLPMHLTSGQDRYGLVYIYPVDDQYVLVSSGVPWWEIPSLSGGSYFAGQIPALTLSDAHDFVLYDREEERIIVEGRFDNEWRLPAEDARTLDDSGVVSLNPHRTSN